MNALFVISIAELFIGGGGRLLAAGPVSLRMILFALCLCASVVHAMLRPEAEDGVRLALILVGAYLLIHVTAILGGAVRGADLADITTEFQQSLYWLAAPFIAMVLQSRQMIIRAATLAKYAGVVLAFAYLGILLGGVAGVLDLSSIIASLSASDEFAFRSESLFFYKGFLYLGISIIFLMALPGRYSRILAGLVAVALVLTLTRGFILSASFALLLMLISLREWRAVRIASVAVAIGVIVAWIYLPSVDENLLAQRDMSNSARLNDMAFILDHVDLRTILLGNGFGSLINGRPTIENTFLWAFWKTGLLGTAFWISPLLLCTYFYRRIPRGDTSRLAAAFFYGVVLVYIQTLANPYLNNPIGLSYVIVALFALRNLALPATRPAAPARSAAFDNPAKEVLIR